MRCKSMSPDRVVQCKLDARSHETHTMGQKSWTDDDQPEMMLPYALPLPRVAFSGARKMTTRHEAFVVKTVGKIVLARAPLVAVVGGARGFDAFVALWLFSTYPAERVHVHAIIPADRSQVDPLWRAHCHTFYEMPAGTSYQQRNMRMADTSDHSYAFPWHARSEMGQFVGGTWRFAEYAKIKDKLTSGDIFVLEPLSTL
jgi:hypothetical protein